MEELEDVEAMSKRGNREEEKEREDDDRTGFECMEKEKGKRSKRRGCRRNLGSTFGEKERGVEQKQL